MADTPDTCMWFAIGANHRLYYVGKHPNSDDAFSTAEDILDPVPIVWIIDELTAHQWKAGFEMCLLEIKPN